MRDARTGGNTKPHLISEHGAGQQPNKKPKARPFPVATQQNHQRQVQRVVDNYAKNPRESARKLRELGMKPEFIRAVHKSAVPNKKTEPAPGAPGFRGFAKGLDTLGEYTVGAGMVRPSRMPGNILHNLGLGAHGLPTDKKPESKFKRALTTDEFHRYQKTGIPPLDAIDAQQNVGIVPFVPGAGVFAKAAKAARAELEGNAIRNAFHANIEQTVPDAGMARGFKNEYDKQVLRAAKKHGMGPNEYLKRVHEQQPEAVQKAHAGMAGAPAAYKAAKDARSEELGKRVEKMGAAMASGTGSQAIRAGLRELKGPLSTTQFHGLHHMTDAEMESLAEHIRVSDKLTELEKGTAWKSIQDARNTRRPPPPHEQKILERVFGPEFTQQVLAHSAVSKAKHVVVETANIPRAVMSSFDVSAPGRQGLVGLISHPVISSKEIGPMLKSFGSEQYYRDWRRNLLEAHPRYEQAAKDRLAVTDIEHALSNREEPFQSNYAEHIPLVGHVVRGSGRAYNRFLVGQRFGIYNHLATHAEEAGIDLNRRLGKSGETLGEQLAKLSNDATGRGQGRRGGFFERNAVELNATFFSPRLIKSRLDFLNPKAYMGLDPYVRAEKMKMAAKTVGAITTFLYAMSKVPGVKVGVDPRSSDFGKIRIGNTRIDVGGGFNQYIRFIAQEISNGEIDPNTGAVKHGQGVKILNRFWRGKLAPPVSAATNLVFRNDYAEQPLDWKKEIASRTSPLALQDAKGVLDQTHSFPAAAAAYVGSGIGLGVQSYGPAKVAPPKDLRADLKANVRKYFHRGLTPQVDKALKLQARRQAYLEKVMPKRPARGASDAEKKDYALARFNAHIDLLLKMGIGTPAKARHAKKWAAGQDVHKVRSETTKIAHKYFGGAALNDVAKKIRERGGHFYLGDY